MKKACIILLLSLLLISCSLSFRSEATATEGAIPANGSQASLMNGPALSSSPVCMDKACGMYGIGFDYLIVTRPKFVEALAPFIEWKTKKGFRVGLVTVEWLETAYPGRHLAEKMKTGIHELRNRAGVAYVLLVGDTEIKSEPVRLGGVLASYTLLDDYNVPTGYYRRMNSDPTKEVLPSDAYFVEDRDWDPANTGLNPRPDNMESGEGTLQADLYLGRWPVRNASEVSILIEKTWQAARANATSIFFSADRTVSDGVMTACPSWPPVTSYCYDEMLVTARTVFFEANAPHITTESMFVDLNDPTQASAFLRRFLANQGVMAVSYHGWYTCWSIQRDCIPGSDIRFEHVFPLLETEACYVGAFYNDLGTSVGESLLLAPTGPAILTTAPTSALFLRDLRDGAPVGKAFWGTASIYVYWPNPMTLLGDPSLVVFSGP